jgi:hypothetical protein
MNSVLMNINMAEKGDVVELTATKEDGTIVTRNGTVEKKNHGGCIVILQDSDNKYRSFNHNRITAFCIVQQNKATN